MAVGYVLVNVSPGQEYQAFQTIKEIENVTDATLLFGDYDIIIKLEADSLGIIAKTVVDTIRELAVMTPVAFIPGKFILP